MIPTFAIRLSSKSPDISGLPRLDIGILLYINYLATTVLIFIKLIGYEYLLGYHAGGIWFRQNSIFGKYV